MPDVRVRDRATGNERTLPRAVAEMNKTRFVILSEAKDTIQKPLVVKDEPAKQDSPNPPAPTGPDREWEEAEVKSVGVDVNEIEELRAAYATKFGSPPHHRMKAESIKKALEA